MPVSTQPKWWPRVERDGKVRRVKLFALLRRDGTLMPPAMDDDGTASFLCWPTEEEAKEGRKYQHETYGVRTTVVRVS
jgi:hypothetical protein